MHIKPVTLAIVLVAMAMPAYSAPGQTAADDKAEATPDNTRHNKVENIFSTAQDQGNDKADLQLSATLRRKIMHKKGLSTDAQNIKIIAENGCLVLRGPVKTEAEKKQIDAMAKQCCNKVSYKNELEVKNQ